MRSAIRMIGAAMPIDAVAGSRPTRKVDRPMIRMVTRKVYLRPTRSPMRPNTSAPNGRTRKPAAKASSAKMLRVASGYGVKNCAPMMRRQRTVEIEIIPFEDGAERGGEDDLLFLSASFHALRRLPRLRLPLCPPSQPMTMVCDKSSPTSDRRVALTASRHARTAGRNCREPFGL